MAALDREADLQMDYSGRTGKTPGPWPNWTRSNPLRTGHIAYGSAETQHVLVANIHEFRSGGTALPGFPAISSSTCNLAYEVAGASDNRVLPWSKRSLSLLLLGLIQWLIIGSLVLAWSH